MMTYKIFYNHKLILSPTDW